MLINAYQCEHEISQAMFPLWYDERYQWFFEETGRSAYELAADGDSGRHFASVDSAGRLVGVIGYGIIQKTNEANGLYIIRFPGMSKVTFGRDLLQAVDDVFCKFCHNRLSSCVIVGNPAERMYDRWVPRLGGREEGVKRQATTDMAGNLCDAKLYAILREDYLKARKQG